jgi:hypothetical protein
MSLEPLGNFEDTELSPGAYTGCYIVLIFGRPHFFVPSHIDMLGRIVQSTE